MEKINSICIIDDDPITVFGIKRMLKTSIDCDEINTYGNGQLAINGIKGMIENNAPLPQVIFLDINMPIMDGWQFLEEFIKLPIQDRVRINVVTSSIDETDYNNWVHYKDSSHHQITYNNKPIKKADIMSITKLAS